MDTSPHTASLSHSSWGLLRPPGFGPIPPLKKGNLIGNPFLRKSPFADDSLTLLLPTSPGLSRDLAFRLFESHYVSRYVLLHALPRSLIYSLICSGMIQAGFSSVSRPHSSHHTCRLYPGGIGHISVLLLLSLTITVYESFSCICMLDVLFISPVNWML